MYDGSTIRKTPSSIPGCSRVLYTSSSSHQSPELNDGLGWFGLCGHIFGGGYTRIGWVLVIHRAGSAILGVELDDTVGREPPDQRG